MNRQDEHIQATVGGVDALIAAAEVIVQNKRAWMRQRQKALGKSKPPATTKRRRKRKPQAEVDAGVNA